MAANPTTIVVYCGLLITLSAFSVDIMLPGIPRIGEDLGADLNLVQLIVPVFIVAIGVGQFFCGSISDRFGRRPVIIGGLLIFLVGSVLCTFATTIETLLVGRFLQGLGGATGPVIGRTILRDLFSGETLARNMALAMAVFAIGPIIAPLIGAGLMWVAGWRVIFVAVIIFASALLLYCLFALPETIAVKDPNATRLRTWISNTKTVFIHPQSRFYLLTSGLIYSSMLLILTNLPQVYNRTFGISGALFAILFAVHGFGIIVGQIANRALIPIRGVFGTTLLGGLVLFVVATVQLAGLSAGLLNAYLISGLLIAFATSFLIVYANTASLTLDPHGSIAGFTSSFYGFVSQAVGTAIVIPLSFCISGDLFRFCLILFLITALVLVLLGWKSRRAHE